MVATIPDLWRLNKLISFPSWYSNIIILIYCHGVIHLLIDRSRFCMWSEYTYLIFVCDIKWRFADSAGYNDYSIECKIYIIQLVIFITRYKKGVYIFVCDIKWRLVGSAGYNDYFKECRIYIIKLLFSSRCIRKVSIKTWYLIPED